MSKPAEVIKKQLKKILELLGIEAEIKIEESSGRSPFLRTESPGGVLVKLTKTEAPLLIGAKGETLKALQHMLRALVLKELNLTKEAPPVGEGYARKAPPVIILDIEDYRTREEEKLKEYVKKVALIVKETKHAEALMPMSSYKRRLVHLAVSEIPGVETESFGEEPERRIIIKPTDSK